MKQEAIHALGNLRREAANLASMMVRLVKTIDEQGLEISVNSLGEVQGQGAKVDVCCATLATYQRILKRNQTP